MPVESIYAEAFLSSVLKADATLKGVTALGGEYIYRNRAPQTAEAPFVIYSVQSADDVNTANADRMFARLLFQVRVVGRLVGTELQNASRVRVAANRVDALLKDIRRQAYTVDSVTYYFNVWRESGLPGREEPGLTADEWFRSYGGFYRVEIL